MATDDLDTFCEALNRLDVGWTILEWEEVGTVLPTVTKPPVVVAPWPGGEGPPGWDDLPQTDSEDKLEDAKTGVTPAFLAVADYGSIVLRYDGATEAVSLLPERHVAVLRRSDLAAGLPAALSRLGPLLRDQQASVVVATGASATADMGALVRGAHGPRTVHILICTDR